MELFESLLGLSSFNRLRFVNNQNRICLGDNINRSARTELVQFHINSTSIFAFGIECLRIDYHYIDGTVRCKTVNLGKLSRVVDEETNLLTILFCKVFLCHLEGLVDTFTDGNGRNNNDKFTPTVVLVQFIHRFDVGVCFTDTSLHFHGKVETTFQFRRRCNQVCSLNLLNLFQNQTVIEFRDKFRIRPTCEVLFFGKGLLIHS